MTRGAGRGLRLAALGLLLVGCAHERAAEDRDETLPLPATYDRAEGAAEALPAEVEWFDFFAEPALEELIRRALEGNFELQAAWQRVERARALATQARAASWPRLQTEAGVQRERNQVRLPGSGGRRETYAETAYRASLGASYEIDLWGRLRSREEVATLRAEAGQADYRALAMTIAAEVTAAWLDLAELRLRGELLRDRREVARQQLELAERRLGMGQGSALDVTQQAQRVDALDAVLTRQSTALELTRHRLAALVGEAPQRFSVDGGATLPALRGRPPLGLPADLLERRPDVRAAWLRLRAADAETATAVADRLPRLQLDARLFTRATDPAGLLDTLLWSVGAGLSDTLFSGGREEAEVTAAEAAARDQLYTYAGALSTALREVADALAQEDGQRAYLAEVRAQLASAEEALELATERYAQGAVSYLRVLQAQGVFDELLQEELSARRTLLGHRVQLHRALGGDFSLPQARAREGSASVSAAVP